MRIIRILSNALKGRMLVPAFRLNIVVFTVANCDKNITSNSKWEVFSSVHHLTHLYFFNRFRCISGYLCILVYTFRVLVTLSRSDKIATPN